MGQNRDPFADIFGIPLAVIVAEHVANNAATFSAATAYYLKGF